METQLVYLSIPQGTLEKLEIVAAQKGLAVEQVVQEAIDEFLQRPIHLNFFEVRIESISNRGLRGLLLNLRLLFSLHSRIPTNEGLPELVIEYLRPHLE